MSRRSRPARLLVGLAVVAATIAVPLSRSATAAPVLGLTNTPASSTVGATFRGATLSWTVQYKCTSLTEACVNARVVDTLPPGLTLVSGSLGVGPLTIAPGTTADFTLTASAACATVDRTFTNSATFSADTAASVTRTSSITVTAAATCSPPPPPPFSKNGPSVFNPGGRPRYSIVLPARTGAYVAEDAIPANTVYDDLYVPSPVIAEALCGSWKAPAACAASAVTKVRFNVPASSDPAWRLNPDFNYTTAIVAVRIPTTVLPGSTISNTAAITGGDGAGSVSATAGPGNVTAATPMPQIAKWVDRVPGTRVPDWVQTAFGPTQIDDAQYGIWVDNDFNAGAAGQNLVDPVIVDLLDADTMWVAGQNWWKVAAAPAGCTTPSFGAIPNWNSTGRTLLRWTFTGCTLLAAQQTPPAIDLRFSVRLVPGTPATTNVTNDAAIAANGATAFLSCGPHQASDVDDIDGDGNRTEQTCATAAAFNVPKLAVFESSKWVNGAADPGTTWTRYPATGVTTATSNGYATYRLFLRSMANIDADTVELVDVLPFVGDTAVSEPSLTRDSEWSQLLAGPVTLDVLPHASWDGAKTVNQQAGYTALVAGTDYVVEYSASTNPCRLDGAGQLKFAATGPAGCASDWGPSFVGAKAFRVRVLRNLTRYQPASGSGDVLRVSFRAVDAGTATDDVGKVAWNSFGYTVTDVTAAEALTAEPIKVGVQMTGSPTVQASLGDRVWYDEDDDGVQDAFEEGIAGVTVSLYDAGGHVLGSVRTDANGRYRFDGLDVSTTYSVRLDNPADGAPGGPLAGFRLSPQNAAPGGTNDDAADSDAQLVSGTPTIASAPTAATPSHVPTYDVGFWKQPAYSIGNRVFFDDDASGDRNGTEAGVDGVQLQLLAKQVDGSFTPAGTDTTANGGYYRFDGLPAGDYKVVLTPANWATGGALVGRRSSTGPSASADPNDDHDLDDNGLQPASIAAYATDGVSSAVVTLGPGKSEPTGETELSPSGQGAEDRRANLTVDFGVVTPRFAVGNVVWWDDDRDGVQTAGEAGVDGVTVTLYDAAGTAIATTTTGTGPGGVHGFYLFDDLLAGTYSVGFGNIPLGTAFTGARLGGHDDLDSDADPTDGRSATFVLDESLPLVAPSDGTGLKAGNVLRDEDAGIVRVYSLGNVVWHDVNGNARIDSGEPGLDGVTVSLYAADPSGQPHGAAVASQITSNGGAYLFTGLPDGSYVVVIGASQLARTGPLGAFVSSGTVGTAEPTAAAAETNADADDNGTLVRSGAFAGSVMSSAVVLGPVSSPEPSGEPATPGHPDTTPDAQSNATVDFGFVTMSLGSLVWQDTDNNGVRNGTEPGIGNVPVRVYRDDDANGTPDGDEVATTVTNGAGEYVVTGLAPGKYLVEIVAPSSMMSSSGNPTGYVGDYEPGKPDGWTVDSADHGTAVGNVIRSSTITLSPAAEPGATIETAGLDASIGNPAVDANTDLTVDFGLVPAASLGDYVWLDNDRNGIQDDAADAGINGVTVRLLGPDDRVIRTTTTATGATGRPGFYRFDVLPGAYHVRFDLTTLPDGFAVSPRDRGAGNAVDSDGDPSTGVTVNTTLAAGDDDPTWDLGVYPLGVVVGNQVWLDGNANGRNDDGPTSGVPGVRATLLDEQGRPVTRDIQGHTMASTTLTDAGGWYLFDNLPPGKYHVRFELPAGYATTRTDVGSDDSVDSDGLDPVSARLRGGQSDLTLDLGLVRPVLVGDRTFLDLDLDGVQTPADLPLGGVVLQLVDATTGQPVTVDAFGRPVAPVTTGADGAYLFRDLFPGRYRVRVVAMPPGHLPTDAGKGTPATDSSTGEATSVDLLGGDEDRTLDFGFVHVGDGVTVAPPLAPGSPTTTAPPRGPVTSVPAASPAVSPPMSLPPGTPPAEVAAARAVPVAPPAVVTPPAGGVSGSKVPRELAFTGPTALAALVRVALLLLGAGLVVSVIGRPRRRPMR